MKKKSKKEKMLDVKFAKLKYIVSFILVVLIHYGTSAQNLKPTNNNGGYTIDFLKNETLKKMDSIVIFGKVLNIKNKNKIGASEVTYGCTEIETSKNGIYKFKTSPNNLNTNYLKATGLGYKTIETEFFEISPGDSININFYLTEDNRPIIDCAKIN